LPEGFAYLGFEELGSTSDFARDIAADWFGENEMAVWIHAEVQTSGRGRRGREWASKAGNLSATLLMRPECDAQKGAELSFVSALAISDVLTALSPIQPIELKWPNDVLLGGKKISGILLESSASSSGMLDWVSIGCGVNLEFHPENTPFPATSLKAASIPAPSTVVFLEALSVAFLKRCRTWQNDGFEPIRVAWLSRARGKGEAIEARLAKETVQGTFIDLDERGALVLQLTDGTTRNITAGEVFFV
jgi:BirA family transcriptional regulator, biotin operon repressor / biotin---[acetyl-CoA-carboxylase] ligase